MSFSETKMPSTGEISINTCGMRYANITKMSSVARINNIICEQNLLFP